MDIQDAQDKLNEDHSIFSPSCLSMYACDLRASDVEHEPDLMLLNAGAAAEQVVGQHLLYARHYRESPELFYRAREKSTSAAEIDYAITSRGMIVPVEVKAGKTGRLRSLRQDANELES